MQPRSIFWKYVGEDEQGHQIYIPTKIAHVKEFITDLFRKGMGPRATWNWWIRDGNR